MIEFYLPLRHLHIGCAVLSITLFVLRGALMLTTVIRQYPFSAGWLTTKVVLLLAYIVLGSVALTRGRTKPLRVAALVAALLTVGFLVSVARAHHPLGLFAAA
jgi:uncharacterized membrane protein SirB2